MDWRAAFEEEVARLERDGLRRDLRMLPAVGGVIATQEGRFLNFSSNDYLDLATDSRVIRAAQQAAAAFGCGATASRLMSGHLVLHEMLEQGLAELTDQEAALVFPSGYQANVAALGTLAGRGDHIFSDRLNHASLIDGARLSRATIHVYAHKDVEHLEALLRDAPAAGRRIIVTDSVFSMDGDVAPVEALAAAARRHGAMLYVDEAHALGIFGDGGGICRARGVRPEALSGTMSKALGSAGGFVAGTRALRDLLVNRARGFIYSTGLAPACAGGALAAVELLRAAPDYGAALPRRAARFQQLLVEEGLAEGAAPETQILQLPVGDNRRAVALAERLRADMVLATAVRPPTVPPGTARLRLSVTLAHSEEDLAASAASISRAALELGAA